ncbi:MAG: hypothetical protein ABIQ35_02990 [Verrucomicrobiota bacterium]
MKEKLSKQTGPEPAGVRQELQKLRDALLHLHKVLIDSERVGYEKTVGAIQSPNHFFQLLTNDPWFAWLGPISQLIVAMDETLDDKEPLTSAAADGLVNQTSLLLIPSEEGQAFGRHYFEALQRDPDVVLAHAEATKFRKSRKGSVESEER